MAEEIKVSMFLTSVYKNNWVEPDCHVALEVLFPRLVLWVPAVSAILSLVYPSHSLKSRFTSGFVVFDILHAGTADQTKRRNKRTCSFL